VLRRTATFDLSPGLANVIVVVVAVPAAILAARAFMPINEWAIAISRRLGRAVIAS